MKQAILYFEGNNDLADAYKIKLEMEGFKVVHYQNPTNDPVALVLEEKPDLILTNILMEKLDGFSAAQAIKIDERTKHIPIIAIATLDEKEDRERGEEVGMTDYLAYTDNPPAMVAEKIKRVLNFSNE